MPDPGFLTGPTPLAFAHRGFAPDGAENSMAAFARAVGLGYRYLETDVHITADGVLLAFHDDVLDRVTDRVGIIAELPWAQVRRAMVDGREPIPRFEDLLGAFPEARINVDPKHDAACEPLADAIRRQSVDGDLGHAAERHPHRRTVDAGDAAGQEIHAW